MLQNRVQTLGESDAAKCPQCDYTLTSFPAQGACPECGTGLSVPLSQYRPSQRTRGLSRVAVHEFWKASRDVVGRPWSFSQGPPVIVRLWPSVVFVVAWMTVMLLAWMPLRQIVAFVSHNFLWGPTRAWRYLEQTWSRPYANTEVWPRYAHWVIWTALGWWLTAVLLVAAIQLARGRSERPLAWSRLALIAPLILLADQGFSIASRVVSADTVPEPGTVFVADLSWNSWMVGPWPARAVPLGLFLAAVGMIAVGLRLRRAIAVAAVLVVPALIFMVSWSKLYLVLRQWLDA